MAKEQQGIYKLAGMASNSDSIWKAWDIYSRDLDTLINKHGVHVKRTSEAIFKAQLAAWDKVIGEIHSRPSSGALHQEGARKPKGVGQAFYAINNEADYKAAYEHYFGNMKV